MLLIGWEEGHPTCKNHSTTPLIIMGQPANPDFFWKMAIKMVCNACVSAVALMGMLLWPFDFVPLSYDIYIYR